MLQSGYFGNDWRLGISPMFIPQPAGSLWFGSSMGYSDQSLWFGQSHLSIMDYGGGQAT
jgi:hypothetical protein